MRFWYRAMVTFLAVTSVFCMTVVVYVGFELWGLTQRQQSTVNGDRIWWTDGFYEGTCRLNSGMLEEMMIRRALPEMPG